MISSKPLLKGLQHESKQCIVPAYQTPLDKVHGAHDYLHAKPFSS